MLSLSQIFQIEGILNN